MGNKLNFVVGEPVLCEGRYGEHIYYVKRLTKTQVIVSAEPGGVELSSRFRIQTGREIGADVWTFSLIKPATDADVLRVNNNKKMRTLRAYIKDVFPSVIRCDDPDKLQMILDIIRREFDSGGRL